MDSALPASSKMPRGRFHIGACAPDSGLSSGGEMEVDFDLREHECPSPSSHSPFLVLDRSPRWRSREKLKKAVLVSL